MRTIEKARQRGGSEYSSYSDTLEGLAVGEQVLMTRSCTLLTVETVEHLDGGLVVFGGPTEFSEPVKPARKRRASRKLRRGEVGPGAAGADNGGFVGHGCLD